MTIELVNKSTKTEAARAALSNIKRMLQGEVPFPKDEDEARNIIDSARPVAAVVNEPVYDGTVEELFELIERAAELSGDGFESWSARKLMSLLGYGSNWGNFEGVIYEAQIACQQSGQDVGSHFARITHNAQELDSATSHSTADVRITRYGAYLIALNGDVRKKQISFAQTYFATQTRRQELSATPPALSEIQKRIDLRDKVIEHNKDLTDAAWEAGVVLPGDFAAFHNAGYRGLYDGLDVTGVRSAKGLPTKAKILDHMGSTELAAHLFRATQTEDKLRREEIQGKEKANAAHFDVSKKVRKAIADIGGTMPEDLAPEEDIDKVRRRLAKTDRLDHGNILKMLKPGRNMNPESSGNSETEPP